MKEFDSVLWPLEADFRKRVEKRIQAQIKDVINSPEVKTRIEKTIEQRIQMKIGDGTRLRDFADWAKIYVGTCVEDYIDARKAMGLIRLLLVLFPSEVDRDKLMRRYGIPWHRFMCVRCEVELQLG